ncbi:MAG: cysteate synthase [Bacteroidia bacterium]|nr:cysteate synthase [Bacteroidia bacterium]
MAHYKLKNFATGNVFEDIGWMLSDPSYDKPSLIRAVYENKKLSVGEESDGIYKFADWLPINRNLKNSSSTKTYRSSKLASHLGFTNLYISYSGYWPQIGADMTTCSFKETEAYSVCARLTEQQNGVMVVASAGNTARAFAKVCSDNDIPLLLIIPESNIDSMWFEHKIKDNVKLICTPVGSDYFDSIDLSIKICKSHKFFEEGGAKNVARRDGMGTTVLSAATTIGVIPDYYFQAIGSGTGTIAAWEANLRLLEDGSYGNTKMKLVPSQNIPFTPILDAWERNSRQIIFADENEARKNALKIDAKVLSNRRPPYGIPGGLYDALKDTDGTIEAVTNKELEIACNLFESLEGVDIHPASGVALAGMLKFIQKENIDKESVLMLNITGGGEKLFKSSKDLYYLKPDMILDNNLDLDLIIKKAESLFY